MLRTPTYRPCPACDAPQATQIVDYSRDEWVVAECDGCAFVYLRNPPSYEALEEDFAWEKTYVEKKEASKGSTWFSPLGRKIKAATKMQGRDRNAKYIDWFQGGSVIDVGCGWGNRIPEPLTPYGIELSNMMHETADAHMKARGGYCIHGPGADAIWDFPEGAFDGVIMNSYLEHETEVMKVLNGAARALKATGALFVRVPNFASLNRRVIGKTWCGFRYPDHVNYFTPDSLRKVAAQAGFTVQITNALTLPIDDNINALLRRAA
ncbi:class I SAM-dependent methyltransferase [uncultured Litoreibacter sp.]|uniref:class I SAM-dependent methyltransferase n=1 Tax=uncultured Litoreibacter sp. TaxID=1392394 RepID=UPI002605B203|nr:class I SAM-dependent methyltransferase [uncultured Litoreibacter sp.]